MKRSTAIRHLVEPADVASDGLRFATTETGPPLAELWVPGDGELGVEHAVAGARRLVGAGSVEPGAGVEPATT